MIPRRPHLIIDQLSDRGGQYIIRLTCKCGHCRQARPDTLAAFSGWECELAAVVKRLRCSKCGERHCSYSVRRELKRDN